MKQQTKRKQILILTAAVAVILAAGIAVYERTGGRGSGEATSREGDQESVGDNSAYGQDDPDIPVKTEYTEEEKGVLESQTGVTVQDDGTVAVDLGQISGEEASMPVSKEAACELVETSVGEKTEVTSISLRKHDGKNYWAAYALKGGEAYQVWIDAETGSEFLKQKES